MHIAPRRPPVSLPPAHRSRQRRARRLATLAGALTLAIPLALPAAATAVTPTLGSSYAAAAKVTPGSGVTASVSTSGAIGGLLDFLTPVLDDVVTPLSTQLTALPGTLVDSVVAGLLGTGFSATSPGAAQSPPASGYPDCSTSGWNTGDCYGPLVPSVSAAPLVTIGTGTVQGYAAADATGSYARAQTTDLVLSLLGVSIGDLGVATSSSQCLATRVCSSAGQLAGVSLFGGALAVRTDSTGALQVSVGGGAYASLTAFTSTTVTGSGVTAHAAAQGSTLRVGVDLTLDQLLTTLGIADTLSQLGAADAGSTVTLTLSFGSGTSTGTDDTRAWGLDIGVGLAVNASISVLGLVSVNLTVSDTSANGDLLDLQLGYSAAANADDNPTGGPPNLT
jgi:hypothetical protein